MKMDVLNGLNEKQSEAVKHGDGAVVVVAGAGSGKTKTIVQRVAYLISEKNIKSYNILVLTFTNKAANELKARLKLYLNVDSSKVWTGTFHSICLKILRNEIDYLSFDKNFSIYDVKDQKSLMKKIYKENNFDKDMFPINAVMSIISKEKSNFVLPEDFLKIHSNDNLELMTGEIYKKYQEKLKKNNAMDFDDILLYTASLLSNHKNVRIKYQNLFKYIMIDEYQDTNYTQFILTKLLTNKNENIFVVGDDDQAIYSWRGANIKNFLEFSNDFKNVKVIKLEENYRSTKNIINLAESLIENNNNRYGKKLFTNNVLGEKPILVSLDNEYDEARQVVSELKNLKSLGISLNDVAVLYRTNFQSRVFESVFLEENIPYVVVGGVNFLERKEIKDIIAYLRILINKDDSEAIFRVLNFTKGIGKLTIEKLIDKQMSYNKTIIEIIEEYLFERFFKGSILQKIKNFSVEYNYWEKKSKELPLQDLVKGILDELGWIELYKNSNDIKESERADNLKEFLNLSVEFSEDFKRQNNKYPFLEDFLQSLSLKTDLDYRENNEMVKLMTIHNSKGLEFDAVFVVGLEDEILPHRRNQFEEEDIEEERRLFYVALTRAKKYLYLSYARYRRSFDIKTFTKISRFISELNKQYLTQELNQFYEEQSPLPPKNRIKKDVILESEKHFSIGQKVKHKSNGIGCILSVDGKDEDAKLTISFTDGSLKKIVGKYVEIIKE